MEIAGADLLRDAMHRAIDHEQVLDAVAVVVEHDGAEPGHVPARPRQPARPRTVGEHPRPVVDEQRVVLAQQVGNEDVDRAVAGEIVGHHAHVRLRLAVGVEGRAEQQRVVDEGAIALVDPEVVGHEVVGHEEVDPSVGVEVRGHRSQRGGRGAGEPGPRRHVLERPVAAVAQQSMLLRGLRQRPAVSSIPLGRKQGLLSPVESGGSCRRRDRANRRRRNRRRSPERSIVDRRRRPAG